MNWYRRLFVKLIKLINRLVVNLIVVIISSKARVVSRLKCLSLHLVKLVKINKNKLHNSTKDSNQSINSFKR